VLAITIFSSFDTPQIVLATARSPIPNPDCVPARLLNQWSPSHLFSSRTALDLAFLNVRPPIRN